MASTYTANSGLEKIGTGEQSGTWGATTNTNMDIIDRTVNGWAEIDLTGLTSYSLSTSDGSLSPGHYKILSFSGTVTGQVSISITPNDQAKIYFVKNGTSQELKFLQSAGYTIVPAGKSSIVYATGGGASAQVYQFNSNMDVGTQASLQVDNINIDGNTISSTDTNGNITFEPNGVGYTSTPNNVCISVNDKYLKVGAGGYISMCVDANGCASSCLAILCGNSCGGLAVRSNAGVTSCATGHYWRNNNGTSTYGYLTSTAFCVTDQFRICSSTGCHCICGNLDAHLVNATANTLGSGTNTTGIATAAFVQQEISSNTYSLPAATQYVRGGIKIWATGSNLCISTS